MHEKSAGATVAEGLILSRPLHAPIENEDRQIGLGQSRFGQFDAGRSTASLPWRRPAVSQSSTGQPSTAVVTVTASRVVPGVG